MTARRRLTAFTFVWALATLNHQNYQGRVVNLEWVSILDFVALYAILRPSSRRALFALAAAQLVTMFAEMPWVVNHWLLMGAANLGLLLWLGPSLLRDEVDDEARIASAASMLRGLIVTTYFFAALAKLNSGFFDPVFGCAVQHYGWVTEHFPFFPSGQKAALAATIGTLLVEFSLAGGLFFRRTRLPTLALGWGFHLLLGWNAFYDFSLVAVAFYVMFLPDGCFTDWDRTRERWPWLETLFRGSQRAFQWPVTLPLAMLALLALSQLGQWTGTPPHIMYLQSNALGKQLFVGIWIALGGLAVLSLLSLPAHVRLAPTTGERRSIRLWFPAVLLVLNGLMPFVGLKTEHSFTMFSNVQTEGERWNHYVFPRWLRVFHFQDDLIRVVQTTDPALSRIAGSQIRFVPFDLRNRVEANPMMKLKYEYRGKIYATAAAWMDPLLGETTYNSPVLKRLLLFRPVQPAGANRCVH